ncbi:hypothetical protein C8A01DRAFT_20367 [Parachaetomium inaequale]|uniref:LysM domain-containing protein n=1 Tax=Parachaetomium inaequale TaxID=2588326 RepID=A0AAN6SM01_9PEZI|nr:hypothetical protein C8A01DRAFT_20367 [Parachaetomium inaequale]
MFLSLQATVSAQTFADYPLSNVWPGISPACLTALNTTVDCSWLLAESAENQQPRLNAGDLTALCTPSCLPSLNNAKATIQAACTLATDAITLDTGTYPATYLVDLVVDPVHRTAQEYCDVLFAQWLNQPSLSAAQGRDRDCSDCMLGVVQLQLNSPFGYDADFASEFVSLTSSCSKTGYAFTSPPPYTVSATGMAIATGTSSSSPSASPTDVLEPGCVSLYTIQAGDTCNSIALAQNVSTFAVYGSHGITDCSNLPAGSKLCLLGQCLLHQVHETDTCDSIIAGASITVSPSMFVAWNPNIDAVCSNLHRLVGMYICLSRPVGLLTPNITVPDATAPATATAWPTIYPPDETQLPMAPGTLTGCQRYVNYRDVAIQDSFYQPEAVLFTEMGNHCTFVAMDNDILLDDLLSWNPSLNEANCALAAGYSYCVSSSNSSK